MRLTKGYFVTPEEIEMIVYDWLETQGHTIVDDKTQWAIVTETEEFLGIQVVTKTEEND